MMSPSRTSAGYLVLDIDWTVKLGIRINRSSWTKSRREYNAIVALLWELRENGQTDVLRAYARGDIDIAELKQAKRSGRIKSDTLLTDLVRFRPLWHVPTRCPKAIDPAAAHTSECMGAIERALPQMGRSAETRRRYETSFVKLQRVAGEWLPSTAQVRDLEKVPWRTVRERWTVAQRKKKLAGKSKRAKAAGYVVEERPASNSDWNALVRAVSHLLTILFGDVYASQRREIVKKLERAQVTKRRPPISRGNLFWEIVERTPEHARPCYIILGATGMRTGEYLSAGETSLHEDVHAIDVVGKTGAKRYFIAPDLWEWVTVGIPSPLGYQWMREYFKRAVRQLGYPELRLHDLRHLFAQLAKQAGVPTRDTQAALGQATAGITADYELEEQKSEVAETVGQALLRRKNA